VPSHSFAARFVIREIAPKAAALFDVCAVRDTQLCPDSIVTWSEVVEPSNLYELNLRIERREHTVRWDDPGQTGLGNT